MAKQEPQTPVDSKQLQNLKIDATPTTAAKQTLGAPATPSKGPQTQKKQQAPKTPKTPQTISTPKVEPGSSSDIRSPTKQEPSTPTTASKNPKTPQSTAFSRVATMGNQKTPRPQKRHLVRWTDDMDKKLLLTMQSACNMEGVNLPWDRVGQLMGDQISGGAVIQHLAKLRSRMMEQGLAVPPPLRRGGSTRISTGYSGNKSNLTPVKSSARKPSTPKSVKKSMSDEEDSDGDDWGSDSGGEYGKARVRRTKSNQKAKSKTFKQEGSDDEEETPGKIGDKRKRVVSKLNTPSKAARIGLPASFRDLNVGSEHDSSDSPNSENSENEEPRVGAGASFMSLVDSNPRKGQVARKTTSKQSSLIVNLRYGTSHYANSMLQHMGLIPREHVEIAPSTESNDTEGEGEEEPKDEDESMALVPVQRGGEVSQNLSQGNPGYGTVPAQQSFVGQDRFAGNFQDVESGMSKGGPYNTPSMYMNPSVYHGGNIQFGSMGGAPGYGSYGDFGTNTLHVGNSFVSNGPGNHVGLRSNGCVNQSDFLGDGSSHPMVLPSNGSKKEIGSSSNGSHIHADFLGTGAIGLPEFQTTFNGYQLQFPSKPHQPATVAQQPVGPGVKTASNSGPSTNIHTPSLGSTGGVGDNDGSFGWEFEDFEVSANDDAHKYFGPFDGDVEGYGQKYQSSG